MSSFTTLASLVLLGSTVLAQSKKDQPDVIELTNGKEIRGRVARAYDADEVLILQEGKRVRVPRDRIAAMKTLNDHLRDFHQLRATTRGSLEREWMLVDWATSRGLDKMARLQALFVVLEDDRHQGAHEFLGHRERKGEWFWQVGSEWKTRGGFDQYHEEWGHPLVLDGEHFRVRTNAGLRIGLNALFDLEHFYVWWMDSWGKALLPNEVIDPMDFHIHDGIEGFPAWTSTAIPYYFPEPNGDVSYTYVRDDNPSPDLLFHLASSQMLYNALADGMGVTRQSPKDRFAPWLEIGLGQWAEHLFLGEAGYAEPAKHAIDRNQAMVALRGRTYGLENLIGLRYDRFHDVTDQTTEHWANSATFVAFLMSDDEHRAKLLEYVRLAYGESKGNSSSLFDKTFGLRIESLEKPWITWLERQVGVSASRK